MCRGHGDRFGCGYCPSRYEHWDSYRPDSRCRVSPPPWPVVVVGPTTDWDVGTADGAVPYDDDFDPITTESDHDEVTAVAPDGADLEPTSLDLASTRGGDTTTTMPVGTGRMIDGVSDGGVGTDDFADEVLSDDDAVDFDPHSAWGGDDEVTAALPRVNGADLEPTSPDLTSTRDSDTAAAMPAGTGRMVDDVSDGGFGTDYFADEVLSDDEVDFDPNSAWGRGGEVTAALPDGAPAATITVATTGAKRKQRPKRSHPGQNARKHQRRRPSVMHDSAPGTDTGSASGSPTMRRAGRGRRVGGGWRCG